MYQINRDVKEVEWVRPGTAAGNAMVEDFIDNRLKLFGEKRNDPNVAGTLSISRPAGP